MPAVLPSLLVWDRSGDQELSGETMKFLRELRLWRDERGGGTIWGLLWFVLMVGICGLAVDSTDGFRSRTMLQATADSAALAAAIDLGDSGAVTATAVSYGSSNMSTAINGAVVDPSDVLVGKWDPVNRQLDTSAALPDAVMVTARRSTENGNPLATNFLRIIGLMSWNVNAQAVAQKFIPDCLRNGLVARGIVDISSNNGFVNKICVHGQQGVDMSSNNFFEPGVNVSMPDLDMLSIPASGMTSNIGLPQALRESSLDPRMVNHVDEIMQSFLDIGSASQPTYIDTSLPVIVVDEKFDLGNIQEHRVYHVQCKPNKNAVIPSNVTIQNVVIIAECQLKINAGASVYSAVLGSRSGGNGKIDNADITIASGVQLGLPDSCAPGGGVQLFSNATIHTASTTGMDGVQIVAAGDVDLGARDLGINGISVQTGQDITLTSNNMFGLCSTGAPDLFTVDYYRLVL